MPGRLCGETVDADVAERGFQGVWLDALTVYLDNRQMGGRPGFYVVTPLKLADGRAVLVQRGWAPRDLRDRTRVPSPPTPATRSTAAGANANPTGTDPAAMGYNFSGTKSVTNPAPAFVERVQALKVGPGLEAGVDIGPLINPRSSRATLYTGIAACLAVIPLALISGPMNAPIFTPM